MNHVQFALMWKGRHVEMIVTKWRMCCWRRQHVSDDWRKQAAAGAVRVKDETLGDAGWLGLAAPWTGWALGKGRPPVSRTCRNDGQGSCNSTWSHKESGGEKVKFMRCGLIMADALVPKIGCGDSSATELWGEVILTWLSCGLMTALLEEFWFYLLPMGGSVAELKLFRLYPVMV